MERRAAPSALRNVLEFDVDVASVVVGEKRACRTRFAIATVTLSPFALRRCCMSRFLFHPQGESKTLASFSSLAFPTEALVDQVALRLPDSVAQESWWRRLSIIVDLNR